MTATEQRIVTALEHTEQIATKVLATMASITLCQLEQPVVAIALATGATVQLAPATVVAHVVSAEEWRLFDRLVAQLREAKDASAELVRQLSESPDAR
jgi:hypothetical protein